MTRYDTPLHVAELLAKHAPRGCRSVLDPSVGSGVLVRQFRKLHDCPRIEVVDIDRKATAQLSLEPEFKRVTIHSADFLRWSTAGGDGNRKRFDCVVMNPPFAGTKDNQVKIALSSSKTSFVPVEVAFVFRSLELLRAGGRMIAIVPASIISGASTAWLRESLMKRGNVRLVHELPNWTFSGIDGRIYILVYDHMLLQRRLKICNHRLQDPDVILVDRTKAEVLRRWDFGYVQAGNWCETAERKKVVGWRRLGDTSDICRGTVASPVSRNDVLHTTNLTATLQKGARKATAAEIRPGDLVMSRVGRRSALSPTLFQGTSPVRGSDCILRIRPDKSITPAELLLALRTVVSWPTGSPLIERGVGARYVTMKDLEELRVPTTLGKAFPALLRRYERFVAAQNWTKLLGIEEKARRLLSKCGSAPDS